MALQNLIWPAVLPDLDWVGQKCKHRQDKYKRRTALIVSIDYSRQDSLAQKIDKPNDFFYTLAALK